MKKPTRVNVGGEEQKDMYARLCYPNEQYNNDDDDNPKLIRKANAHVIQGLCSPYIKLL